MVLHSKVIFPIAVHRFPVAASLVAILVCCVALLGWTVGVVELRAFSVEGVTMNPTTALAGIVAALSLGLQVRRQPILQRIGRWFALPVALVGAIVLGRYVNLWSHSPDTVIFRSLLAENRMAPNTAIVLVLLGIALGFRCRAIGPCAGAIALTICGFGFVGYSFQARPLYGIPDYMPMAFNTIVALGFLGLGLIASRPDHPLASVFLSTGPGGVLARRLGIAAILIPWGLGFARLFGEKAGFFSAENGVALMVVATIGLFCVFAWILAASLDRADAERRAAEEDLRASTAEIHDLYHMSPCGYHSVGPDGILLAINRTSLKWLGYEAEEVVGRKRFSEFVHPAFRDRYFKAFAVVREQGAASDVEVDLLRRDGTVLPVLLNSTAILDSNGEYRRSRTTLTDLTERKRAEDAARKANEELERRVAERTKELARSNRELKQINEENEMFVYSVSHDLRSPLVNLLGFSKELDRSCAEMRTLLVDERLPPDVRGSAGRILDEEVAESLHYIESSVRRLSGIIDAMLRLSRAGRVPYQRTSIDLNVLVKRIIASLKSSISARGAEVVVKPLPTVFGDPTALDHTLANLIGNAVNYLEPSRPGRIEIGADSISIESSKNSEARSVRIYVKDNGLGIPNASREKVFRAFQRIHPASATGEGMGLAIVNRTVQRHGGKIWFESEVGRGTTFFVDLPEDPGAPTACAPNLEPTVMCQEHVHAG